MAANDPEAAHVEALKRAAEADLAGGRVQEARRAFSEALRLKPRDLEARDGIVRCLVAIGDAALAADDPDRAVTHYQLALELSPFHPGADAGLRRGAAHPKRRTGGADPLLTAFDALPPVKIIRDLQLADRVVGKVAGMAPSEAIRGSLETRRTALALQGAPPRDRRIEHEKAAAWRKRWVYRAVPAVVGVAALALFLLTGSVHVLTWGLVLGFFSLLWDVVFVETGASAHRKLEAEGGAP